MTEEEKQLLLKDLCGRLPYRVKLETLEGPQELDLKWLSINMCNIASPYLPYLYPISSMTDEQKKTLKVMCDWNDEEADAQSILVLYQKHFVMKSDVIDWLNKNHFDYRGLIKKGLALDVTGLNIY